MRNIAAVSHSILSPLGLDAQQTYHNVIQQKTAIRLHEDSTIAALPFYAARLLPDHFMMLQARYGSAGQVFSPFEQMCIYVVEQALGQINIDTTQEDCVLILSTTKGNIEWLDKQSDERISLHYSAKVIAAYFQMKITPVVVSNACISGSLALLTGARLLENGKYAHAIVVGCDRLSAFVYAGFESFHALSDGLCRPFDKKRTGINLGEAAACMILSNDEALYYANTPLAFLKSGAITNDANHLSGPSRTGAELSDAINTAIAQAGVHAPDIGMISAHGTATLFNDEMEAKAIHLSGLGNAPLHSLKSYLGHTLGAAGILESIIACMAIQDDLLPVSLGFNELGVSEHVNVVVEHSNQTTEYLLKTASGFGGCNAALVWGKTS